ncbi:MAG: DUF4189 domain-containing protein [Sulfuricella sp.]|nr:DUF4189 domain-containing protein [Sulfuricella sp.]
MRKILGLLLCLTFAAPLSAFAVGAIAVDDMAGDKPGDVGYYVAAGEKTKEAVKKAALKGCKDLGLKNCRIGVWYSTCGAYATSIVANAYGIGKTKEAASNAALKSCGKACEIVAAECE